MLSQDLPNTFAITNPVLFTRGFPVVTCSDVVAVVTEFPDLKIESTSLISTFIAVMLSVHKALPIEANTS